MLTTQWGKVIGKQGVGTHAAGEVNESAFGAIKRYFVSACFFFQLNQLCGDSLFIRRSIDDMIIKL